MVKKRAVVAAAMVMFGLTVAGCATGSVESAPAAEAAPASEGRENGSSADAAVIKQRYDAAFAKFERCVQSQGSQLLNPILENDVWRYSVPDADGEAMAACYPDFADADADWQLANEYDSPTQQALRRCLEAESITPETTVAGVWAQIERAGIDAVTCTTGVTPDQR